MATRKIIYWLVAVALLAASIVNLVFCADRNPSTFSYLAVGLAVMVALIALAGCSIISVGNPWSMR